MLSGRWRVVNEKLAVLFVLWVEGEAEQSFFIFLVDVDDLIFDIEKRFRFLGFLIVFQDVNPAQLRGDEDSV